jgi:hypothetical protein
MTSNNLPQATPINLPQATPINDCPICYQTFTNDLFINCSNNHIACCLECYNKLTDNNCPMCRTPLGYSQVRTTTTTTTTTRITARMGSPRSRINSNNNEQIINNLVNSFSMEDTQANRTWARRSLAQSRRRRREAMESSNNNYDSNIANLIANHRETLNNRQIAQRTRREREARELQESQDRYYDNLLVELTLENNERINEILRLRIH